MQLSKRRSGLSIRIGSGSVTSSAAAAIRPELNASYRASWSTMGPRDVFMSMAVDFILPRVAVFIMWAVAGVSGTWSDTKSDSARSVSRSARPRTPIRGGVGITVQRFQPESLGPLRHGFPDAAKANDAKRRSHQVGPKEQLKIPCLPFSGPDVLDTFEEPSCGREQ